MEDKNKDKIIHSENNKHVKRVISQPTKATTKLVNSVSGGKGIRNDYKSYQRATQMDHIDNKYRRTYRNEQKKYEESNNYQSKTSNDPNNSSGGSRTYSDSPRHNESPAERQARARADQGRDESRSGNLRTQSEQTKTTEPSRHESSHTGIKTQSSGTSSPSSSPKSSDYGNVGTSTGSNNKSYSPADRQAENVARQGVNESGGVGLKTQSSTNSKSSTSVSNQSGSSNKPQTGSAIPNIDKIMNAETGAGHSSNGPQTGNAGGLLPIQIQDETGKTMVLNAGESIMLDNGSIIGYAMDENGEGFIFSNFYDRSEVSGLGNTITTKGHKNGLRAKGAEALGLNEHANVGNVAGGMTLKTGVSEVSGIINVDDFINSDGSRIITVNMANNKKVNKLGTLISKNDQTKNKKLTLDDKAIKSLKTNAKVLFGATVIVRGASFVGSKTIGFFGMMFDGMGSGKSEAEFMVDQVSGIIKGKMKGALKKATVKTGKVTGKVIAKGVGKIGKYGVKAGAWGLNHFKFGRKITSTISKLANKSKIATKFLAKIGRALKAFSMVLKKYLIIAIAFCVFMLGVCGIIGGAAGGMTSIFGFLFKDPETLFEKYHGYIQEVDGMITDMNNNYSKGKMPIYGNDLPANGAEVLDGYDWAEVDASITYKAGGVDASLNTMYNSPTIYRDPTKTTYDEIKDYKPTIDAIADNSVYNGKINGVNWRAFLACVQVYNGFATDLEETNNKDVENAASKSKEYDAYDTDNINPYGRFKDEWKSKDSDFIKPKVSVTVECSYVEQNTNKVYSDDPTKSDEEGDTKYKESVEKFQAYCYAKKEVERYNEDKANYDKEMAEYNNAVKARSNKAGFEDYKAQCATKNKPVACDTYKKYLNGIKNGTLAWYVTGKDDGAKPEPPNPDNYNLVQNQSIVSAGEPNKFEHHYKLIYDLIDEADYSLNTYSNWFKYAMYDKAGKDENGNPKVYELSKEELEILDSLYTSQDIFELFSYLYDSHVTQDMVNKTQQCFERGIIGYDYIIACNEKGIVIGGNITTGEAIKVDTTTLNEVQTKILNFAQLKLGCPYVWGSKGPNTFDCSGLVYWVYAQAGYNVPASTAALASSNLKRVSLSELQPGDILLRRNGNSGHTGIYIGAGQYIHAPHTGDVVKVSSNVNSFQYALRVIESN